MVDPRLILNRYPQQHYTTLFNQKNGALIRMEDNKFEEPFWCSYGPELIDISITNWCDRECTFCYKKSSIQGKHLSLEDYEIILKQAALMKVLQVALGGGNPNQHPDFCELLRLTRDKYNIVPSYTTNGRGLSHEILTASKNYCGAVAVSAYEPYQETFKAAQILIDNGIRTNIHFLLTSKTISTAISWLTNPPLIFDHINAVIFLNYKPVGRNPDSNLFSNKSKDLSTFFRFAEKKYRFKIGFDSCSISGVTKYMNISPIFIERCEAGRFSLYISEEMKMYPCSFMVGKIKGIDIRPDNMQCEWVNNQVFKNLREEIFISHCNKCTVVSLCSGGCPIFPEINLCCTNA